MQISASNYGMQNYEIMQNYAKMCMPMQMKKIKENSGTSSSRISDGGWVTTFRFTNLFIAEKSNQL